jgi:ubiquitin-like-conjugating enzyme ATG3
MEAQLGLLQQQQLHDDTADDDDDDWLVSTVVKNANNKSSLEDDFDILDEEGEVMMKPPAVDMSNTAATKEAENDEYADMADFEDDNVLQDDSAVAAMTSTNEADDADDNLIKVRTYDLSITYDKYYQTPRVWMVGRSDTGQPLTGKQMMEDVMTDYANKTVTIEMHPHVAGPHASIHPCQHGKVMKTIVRNLIRASNEQEQQQSNVVEKNEHQGPSVEMYLFIFLKFVSSIIPTIAYDFTMEVRADTRK